MICLECKLEREEKDFFIKEKCYKCQYAEKVNKKKLEPKKCRRCGNPTSKRRWIYCSDECAFQGRKKQQENYWTNSMRSQ